MKTAASSGLWRGFGTAAAILLVAAGYYVSGRFGLLLAVPPGYATAVWPASGIALAAVLLGGPRLAFGVVLGSFLVNLPTGFDLLALTPALLIPAVIAVGAALQALVGAWLIGRRVGYTNLLEQELQVVPMLLLGGPLACLIASSIGVGTLWLSGSVAAEAALFNWWTWWVGDVIGVLVFTPLVLVWSARPYRRWLVRQVTLTVPLLVMFSVVVMLFVFISQREQARIEAEFSAQGAQFGAELNQTIQSALNVLDSMEGLYASSESVQRQEFEVFGGRLMKQLRGVAGLSWNPLVKQAGREAFERGVRRGGSTDFRITERDAENRLIPAAAAAEYVPIAFYVPRPEAEEAAGFNVLSEPVRRAALESARDSGRAAASGPVPLVQVPGDDGFLVFTPVYRRGVQPAALADRRRQIEGFVVAIFRLQELLESTLRHTPGLEGNVRLYDVSNSREALLYSSGGAKAGPGGFRVVFPVDVAGRQWRAELHWPASLLLERRSWLAWLVLAGGLMLTSLLGVLLLTTIGQTGRVEAQVAQRTQELARANAQLSERGAALANSNRELEQFAYVTSHDLKAPLRTVLSFAELLQKRYRDVLGAEGQEFLDFIGEGVRHMQGLIDDLLKLSQLDRRQPELVPMRLQTAVDRASRHLAADIAASGAQVKVDPLPQVHGDAAMLSQVFQNLIANAIKFMPAGRKPELRIEAHPEGVHWDANDSALTRWQRIEALTESVRWQVIVHDNGIGIDKNHLAQIFSVFTRLHAADRYPGNGIGLAICKKIVGLHGGKIWAESELGKGTSIHFTLPGVPAAQAPIA